ncbi:T9SS type A sorting domain-containing protein [Algibacter sp. 2305UL17-15]|uniref:T9SS type A sorting domain-containing protein n=1 Tax=Algibacter sp. 2305UL17-15 TaxID=3231268 RepID=UPI00345A6179
MKKTLLFLSMAIISVCGLMAQSITVTSLVTNPTEVNSDFTVNMEYTTSNANDIIYIGLELKNSDGSWAATIAETTINPVGTSGTDVPTSAVVTVPAGVTPSADLTGGQYYELKVELNAEAWAGWLAGDYPAMTLAAEGTLSIENNELNKVKVYPNPVSDRLNIIGPGHKARDIKIKNLLGKTVYDATNFHSGYVDTSALSSGIYLLLIKDGSTVSNIKFVKK